jgi:uncharacterized protein YbaR (Trm112 family)/protein-L-isoaspartate O-methyltransferase
MQAGFPAALLGLICCPVDRGSLQLTTPGGTVVGEGSVRCVRCGSHYSIRSGILELLEPSRLHPESALEMQVRDARSDALLAGRRQEWRSRLADETEVAPTLEAVGARAGMTVCELGCGPGRYTLALAQSAAAVAAVDMSRAGLLVLKAKLASDAAVALVQADVSAPFGAPGAFDRMLSTLHSNLPSAAHRRQVLGWMADALADAGRAVVSMHHYTARDMVTRTPRDGRYPDSGIYRYLMTTRESAGELGPFFSRVRHTYIAASLPGLPSVAVARIAARTIGLRAATSSLFLALAEEPCSPYREDRA